MSSRESSCTASGGIGIGAVLAVVLSWIANHSVGWAILHFFCGWLYVIYWALCKTELYNWISSLLVK